MLDVRVQRGARGLITLVLALLGDLYPQLPRVARLCATRHGVYLSIGLHNVPVFAPTLDRFHRDDARPNAHPRNSTSLFHLTPTGARLLAHARSLPLASSFPRLAPVYIP